MSDDAMDGLAIINVDRLSRDVNAIVQASVMIDPSFEETDTDESPPFEAQSRGSPDGGNPVCFRSIPFNPAASVEGTWNSNHHPDTQTGSIDGTSKLAEQLNRGAGVDIPSEHISDNSTIRYPGMASISHLRPILPAPSGIGDYRLLRSHDAPLRSIDNPHIDSEISQLETELGLVGQRSSEYTTRVPSTQPVTSSLTDVSSYPSHVTTLNPNPGGSLAMDTPAQLLTGPNARGPLNIQVPAHSSLHFMNSLNNHSAQNLLAQLALLSPGNPDSGGAAGQSQASSLQSLLSPHSQSALLPYLLKTMASLNHSGGNSVELNLLADASAACSSGEAMVATAGLGFPQTFPRDLPFPVGQDTGVEPPVIPSVANQVLLQPIQSSIEEKLSAKTGQMTNPALAVMELSGAATVNLGVTGMPRPTTEAPGSEVTTLAPSIITSSIHSLCLPVSRVFTGTQNSTNVITAASSSQHIITRSQPADTTTTQLSELPGSRGQTIPSTRGRLDLPSIAMRISNIPSAVQPLSTTAANSSANLVDEFWCSHCDESMPQVCPHHGPPTVIPDTPILSRARMTLPGSLYLKRSGTSKDFIGVWAKEAFKPSCQFGPMEGILVRKLASDADVLSPYIWKVFQGSRVKHYLDIKNEDVSNWMMFVRRARKLEEQNVVAHQVKGELYYTTRQEIQAGEELLLWYNREYAQMTGATLLPEDSFKCALCGRQFCYRQELEGHILYRHPSTSERKHSCRTCGKVFSSSSKLKIHTVRHTGDKPHSCQTCHKSFTDASNLRRHVKVHSGEKQFQCSVCLMTFRQKAHLVTHSVLHRGERKLKCHLCGRTFARKGDVVKHMQLHNGDKKQQCSLCPSSFARKSHLRRHLQTHTRERNFPCEICGKIYQTQGNLLIHRENCAARDNGAP